MENLLNSFAADEANLKSQTKYLAGGIIQSKYIKLTSDEREAVLALENLSM